MCKISLSGYTKDFIKELNELGNMIYPVVDKKEYTAMGSNYNPRDNFSNQMNNTLDKMKKNIGDIK